MNFNEQLREILWQVHKNGQWFATPIAEQKPHSFGKDVQEAETAIHTLIEEAIGDEDGSGGEKALKDIKSTLKAELLAKMPKEEIEVDSLEYAVEPQPEWNEGYNQAITEITKIVNEL